MSPERIHAWQAVAAQLGLHLNEARSIVSLDGQLAGFPVRVTATREGNDATVQIGGDAFDVPDLFDDLLLLHEIGSADERMLAGAAYTEGWSFCCGRWRLRVPDAPSAERIETSVRRGLDLARAFQSAPKELSALHAELTTGTRGLINDPNDRARRLELVVSSFPDAPMTQHALEMLRDDPNDAVRCIVARERHDVLTLSSFIRTTDDHNVRRSALEALFSEPPTADTNAAFAAFADWAVELANGQIQLAGSEVVHVAAAIANGAFPKQRVVATAFLYANGYDLRLLVIVACHFFAEFGTIEDLAALQERAGWWTSALPSPSGPWPAVTISERQLAEAARNAIARIEARSPL